jgi:hypothetical protein
MTKDENGATPDVARTGFDWARVAQKFVDGLIVGALVAAALQAEERRRMGSAPPRADATASGVPEPERKAAALLGVDVDATEKEIRAALRTKLATTHAHPDQGGDLAVARELIAARDLLVERARRRAA